MPHENDAVAEPSAAHRLMTPSWQLVRALEAGTWGMREASDNNPAVFLPQFGAETNAAWEKRKNRSFLTNFFNRATRSLVGKVFAKPVILGEKMAPALVEWSEDIDLMGNNIDRFARNKFEDGVTAGLTHILVDFPRMEPGRTLGEERASGARPYFVDVKAENLLGARAMRINGVEVLTQARIFEPTLEAEGEFGETTVNRVRVLDLVEIGFPSQHVTFRIFEEDDDQEWREIDGGMMSISRIPLITWYTDREAFLTSTLPFMDLAHLNVAHWQSASDQRNILTVARFPIPAGTGISDEEADAISSRVGPNNFWHALSSDAKLFYMEHDGAAIGAGRTDLQDLKLEMQLMAMEPIIPKTGGQTATARALDSSEANSTGQDMALGLENALETAYEFAAEFSGLQAGGVTVNTDFGMAVENAIDLEILLQSRMAGEISREAYLAELKRREVLMDDFSAEDDAEKIADEGPALGTLNGSGEPIEESLEG